MPQKAKLLRYAWFEHPAIVFLLFVILVLIVRLFLRGQMLEIDEAEQVVMAQRLELGYPDQAPLYTWLQFTFFRLFGCRLLSLALLKSLLLFGCLYSFHQICRLHCCSVRIAWCATLTWALIPAISLDLIKDNTHSVSALFIACLTWYWFIKPSQLGKFAWYLVFGTIIGLGLLSKFNYLLFLVTLLLSGLLTPQFRPKLFNPYLFLSILVGLVIASPYIFWLQHHFSLGFRSAYKLASDKDQWHGLEELIRAILFFTMPVFLITRLFFPFKLKPNQKVPTENLLYRYHLSATPLLVAMVYFTPISNFETRWLIPILFTWPLLFFSHIKEQETLAIRVKSFIALCIFVQFSLLIALLYRSQNTQKIQRQFPYHQIVKAMKTEKQALRFIVSDSHWLIGNLMLNFPNLRGWFLHPSKQPSLPKGQAILVWQASTAPFWVKEFARTNHLTEINFINDPQNQEIIAGYTWTR